MSDKPIKHRNTIVQSMIENPKRHAGEHENREYDVKKGRRRRPKHKHDLTED